MLQAANRYMDEAGAIGLLRLASLLNKMQQCVATPIACDFCKYQAYYHVLIRELEKVKTEFSQMKLPQLRTDSENKTNS